MTTGANTLSRRKKKYDPDNFASFTSLDVYFGHSATLGDAEIPFNALVKPTEQEDQNPTYEEIVSLNLFANQKKVVLSSSKRGYIIPTEYRVFSDRIVLKNFTALDGEDFYVRAQNISRSYDNAVNDLFSISEAGVLPSGDTDFNIGKAVPLSSGVVVFRDGIQMFQNTDNSDTTLDGNYYIVPANATEGSIIRFNDPAGASGANIGVYGFITASQESYAYQEIEKLSGQIDLMIPTLAAVAGVDPINFQAAPNSVDLTYFGKLVASIARGQVGDIRSSMLNEAQFQSQNGPSWVLMDGRSVAGSEYENITGNSTIPDARGMFLRGKNNGRTDGFEDPAGERVLGDFQEDAFQGHVHVAPQITDGAGLGRFATSQQDDVTVFGNLNTSDPITDGVNGTPRTDSETRVKNIAVNHFIKIDIS
jgi:hypothetical protein